MMNLLTMFLALFVFSFLFSGIFVNSANHTAYACSCMQPLSPDEELPNYDAVFSGKVADLERTNTDDQMFSSISSLSVKFDVNTVWKGDKQETIILKTLQSSASCGFYFEENQEYIVYATQYNEGGQLEVSLCSRTNLLSNATEDLQELGPGFSMEPKDEDQSNLLPPLKQLKIVEDLHEIVCKDDQHLIFKKDVWSPACVYEDSIPKLIERGWADSHDPTHRDMMMTSSAKDNNKSTADSNIDATDLTENITTIKPNSVEFFYYPDQPKSEKPDTFKLFMLIRLPEWMGGDANDPSAFRAYSAKSLDDACIVKYWPDQGRQRIENSCQGAMYRVIDGAMTVGMIHRSVEMTALPYLDVSIDKESGLLYVEPPTFSKTENGVIGYGRQISFDDFRAGSEFLIDSFAKAYPEYPSIPMKFAGYELSEISPDSSRVDISYLDFPDNSGRISMAISKHSVGTMHTNMMTFNPELWQVGSSTSGDHNSKTIRIGGTALNPQSTTSEQFRTYEIRFKNNDDGFYYAINGKNLEFIKQEIIKNYFPDYDYDDMILVSKTAN